MIPVLGAEADLGVGRGSMDRSTLMASAAASVAILSGSRTVSTRRIFLGAVRPVGGEGAEAKPHIADETNQPVQPGPHASDFGERVDRTQYLGLTVPPGASWQAKSAFS